MKNSAIFFRSSVLAIGLLFTTLIYSQTPDFNVQHIRADVGNSGTTIALPTAVNANNAVAIANNNRKSHAGSSTNTGNAEGDDLAGARKLNVAGTSLEYYRESGSSTNTMRFETSVWEYVGPAAGANEMIVRGRYAITLNGTTNDVTQAISGISNAADCIPFITGIMNNSTGDDADSGTAIAYLENATTMRVQKGSNGNNVTVYITLVEFTGSNWTVLHGDSGNVSADTGSITLRNGSDGTGTATNVSAWSQSIIFSHHRGDNTSSGTNDAIADNWPVMDPGSDNQTVDWTFDAQHDSSGTNRQFVHVLTNSNLAVTRFQDTSSAVGETTINISSAGLSNTTEALIIGSSRSSGGGTAYGRGWRNYYFNSATQAAHWVHRSGNTMAHEIQIVDLSGLNTPISGPEINLVGNSNSIADGDTSPSATDDTDFGSLDITSGTNANIFTIQNTGTSALTVGTVTISGTHAADFTVTSTPAASVAASGSTTFEITFDPSGTGLRVASVSIANDDSDEAPYNFDIQGTGTTHEINIQGNAVSIVDGDTTPSATDDTDFGSVSVPSGTNVNTFTIQNTDTGTLTIGTITISGTHASDFTVTATPAASVGASGSTTFDITFDPTAAGTRYASVSIINGDSDENPYNFDIQGTGTIPSYCNSEGDTSYNTGITQVQFNGINNSDGSPKDNAYEDFTAISTTVTQGNAYDLTIDLDTDGGYDVHTFVWIDWNQDYDFDDPGETYDFGVDNGLDHAPTASSPISITIPGGAAIGSTRMRVSAKYNADPTNCETGFDGEVEDYTIIVAAASPFQEMLVSGNSTEIIDNVSHTPSAVDDTDFGNQDVTSGTSTHTFTIENLGGTNDLNLTDSSPYVVISGAHAGDFTLTANPSTPIAAGGSTTFNITFNPSALGLRTASVSIANDDSDENPYNFNIQGNGVDACGGYVTVFPYTENFESGIGMWNQDTGDNFDWTWQTGTTPTSSTGPTTAHEGSYYMFTEANSNNTNTANFESPCFDLTGIENPRFTFYLHMYGADTGTLNVDISTDSGSTYPTNLWTYTGEIQGNTNSSWTPISVDLSAYVGQTVKIRIQGIVGSGDTSDMAIDYVSVTTKSEPTVAPGGVTTDLALWLKGNDGLSLADGASVSSWTDQGRGSNARIQATGQEPTYRDNVTKNVNFNPVVEFDNTYSSFTLDGDFRHDNTSTQFLTGDFGYYTQDVFIVLIPDDTPITNSFGFMDVFCSDAHLDTNAADATGIGFGDYTGRVTDEIICYAHDSYTTGESGDGYAVAEIGTGSSYDNAGIINTRNNSANTQQELFYNANNIETNQNDIAEYMNTEDSRWWIGRSEGWEATLNARVAEVITYKSRLVDTDLTQARNRIQSYLAIKYGITLGVQGTSQDYVDSSGSVIWDQSSNSGYNYDIAGIGRDDASELNQKQSKSINNGVDGIGETEGILTIGLTDIYDTNNLNIANNTNTLNDREYLVWGNNGADLDLAASMISVNMSAGITPSLNTDVTFTGMQRVWKVVENGGDIGRVKISIPQNAIRNITPPGDYLMFISNTGIFDPTADYRIMTSDGSGNLETEYDFDGTKFITFGYAPQVEVVRSVYFDGVVDYVDMEDKDDLDLNTNEFTMSAWIKRDTGTINASIISKRDAAFTEGYDFRIDNTGHLVMTWNGGAVLLRSTVSIPENEWHQVAVIYDTTDRATLYIDGVADTTATSLASPVATSRSFLIAAADGYDPDTTDFFAGNIDEVRVWKKALTVDQLRYIMNQEIEDISNFVNGTIVPQTITKNEVSSIDWDDLSAYYPMSIYTYTNTNDASGNGNTGALRNLDTVDRQTAPLPYVSQTDGSWDADATWLNNSVQTLPNALSIIDNVTPIDWNIVQTSNDIYLGASATATVQRSRSCSVLALFNNSGDIQVNGQTQKTPVAINTGIGLTVTHYLKLDGTIDLEGESQLIQTLDSDLDPTSAGTLERDQQGTADTFTYNYWSAPVGVSNNTTNNNSYTLPDVMRDGTQNINFLSSGYNGSNTNPIGIADYWIWKFNNHPDDDYASWQHVRSTGTLLPGEGFTMKGPGTGAIADDQNYVFIGKPYNGSITLPLNSGNDYLVGNPYASAIDAHQFINDNGPLIDGDTPLITGTLYFWEHWGGGSHVLSEYQGGYAKYNLSGGTPSASQGTNDPDVATGGTPTKTPGRYIPVNQGFFVVGETTGTINFNNGQRVFQREGGAGSTFMRTNSDGTEGEDPEGDIRMKLRFGVNSVNTIHRQLLVTVDPNATENIDWGYDGKLNEAQIDDMFWLIEGGKYIIQGTNIVDADTVLPIGIKTSDDGINSITIDALENVPTDLEIYVRDNTLGIYHDLRASNYDVYLASGEYLDRFEIVFSTVDSLSVSENELSGLDVHFSNAIESIVVINPTFKEIKSIELLNILGQSIITLDEIDSSSRFEYEVKNLSTGTYVIKLNTSYGTLSKKVLVE